MESRRAAIEVPGMAACIVGSDGIVWEGYFGTYDGEHPVSEDTLFMIASVSKTMIATAIMQLWEQGRFDLDDDINDYLDFDVRNPSHPEEKITFRHLMTHRSSITDRYPFYLETYTLDSGGGDSPWDMGEFLEEYLVHDGQFYSTENYLDVPPGDSFEYTNYGATLLAHLVEVLSGDSFSAYCQDRIFDPLGMEHSYSHLADIPSSEMEIASPFENGTALPHYGYPDYPAGSLRTTIRDLARFASFYLEPPSNGGVVLQPETVELMFGKYGESTDFGEDQMGLIWVHMDWLFFSAIGHTGFDPGVDTTMFLYPDEGFATITFLNAHPSGSKGPYLSWEILRRLYEEGQH
jgi:CubicO group peptidase (beta-lactamase class C family)